MVPRPHFLRNRPTRAPRATGLKESGEAKAYGNVKYVPLNGSAFESRETGKGARRYVLAFARPFNLRTSLRERRKG